MSEHVLSLSGIERTFVQGKNRLEVLRGIDLNLNAGEIVALVGPSGAGKSTLLHIAGLLEKPDSGAISIAGDVCADMDDDSRTLVRRHHVGFVYQYHHLLPEFTAMENIAIPQIISGISRKEARKRSNEMLDWLGLTDRSTHRPARLSGGEQQRVAIGRALANAPKLLLADEPTGNLDPHTAGEVFDVLIRLARGAGLAALIATHNPELASRMDRIVTLEDGHLI
ncbi:MAG: ABC transporter ATP-binding protein [Rhodospirillaceae bacterium]|jgi:lipoprotein-releasing system ATP-binding protein|nr:ABC transporter ATP-binding protein [Rhodospirillaceae bacterium]MBT5244742.1 ABC transporter ATP-binding protein [Rhodospirillaceae bacterium]MBT5562483.1 ABC transporter ATP-binding protein [Rhodospirillaceae bacterium]MBT6242121.1 ABC transporter ATP-binding protein [Rhodospirillaceae bacterium]MBT7138393.1 ABC transporter ATP-binding protein [Rhodospirillaceae bacterium]